MMTKAVLYRATRARTWALPLALAVTIGLAQPSFASAGVLGTVNAQQIVPPGTETQTSEGGQVTIKVTWTDPGIGPVFAVVMDTHSVNLDAYDLAQLAVLRTDQGLEIQPIGWDAPSGSHHREGTLSFPSTAPDGSPLIGAGTTTVELVIRDVAGVPERVLRWTLA